MEQRKLSFPVLVAGHWKTPLRPEEITQQDRDFANWVLWVRVGDLPFDLPLDPNARNPDITKKTPKAIAATLREEPWNFVRMNGGMTVVARACHVKDGTATIILNSVTEEEEHAEGKRGDGVLNGGHSYAVLKAIVTEYLERNKRPKKDDEDPDPDPRDAVVRVEVQTGISEEMLAKISRARNRSEPVKEFSLLNLGNKWRPIEQALPEEMRVRVMFKENDERAPDTDYDVGDLVKVLTLFNAEDFKPGDQDPIPALMSDAALASRWKPATADYLLPRLGEIIRLHDDLMEVYPQVMERPGKVDGVRHAKNKDDYFQLISGKTVKYKVPDALIFPVLAALRVFLTREKGWLVTPEKLIKDPQYARALCEYSYTQYRDNGRSSMAFFGRNKQMWRTLSLMAMLKRAELKT